MTQREKELHRNHLQRKQIDELKQENANLKEAMQAIRFLAFNHEVQTWNDATGTDKEKLHSILILARESNWKTDGLKRNEQIIAKHKS